MGVTFFSFAPQPVDCVGRRRMNSVNVNKSLRKAFVAPEACVAREESGVVNVAQVTRNGFFPFVLVRRQTGCGMQQMMSLWKKG